VNKRKLVGLIIGFVLIACVVGVGVFFIVKPKPIGGPDVELSTQYRLVSMQAGLYYYNKPDGSGMPSDKIEDQIDFIQNDHSFGIFENDWKTFRIRFVQGGSHNFDFRFVVTKLKRGNGGLEGNVTHIYNGKLISYRILATRDFINLIDYSSYEVEITSDRYEEAPKTDIFREDIPIFSFSRKVGDA